MRESGTQSSLSFGCAKSLPVELSKEKCRGKDEWEVCINVTVADDLFVGSYFCLHFFFKNTNAKLRLPVALFAITSFSIIVLVQLNHVLILHEIHDHVALVLRIICMCSVPLE